MKLAYAKLAKRMAELEAIVGCPNQPLRLQAFVVVGTQGEAGDAEAAKARAVTQHLAAHPHHAGRPIAWTIHRIITGAARKSEHGAQPTPKIA
jgi:hypothetical protein